MSDHLQHQGHTLMTLEIEQMLQLQEGINQHVHPDWRHQQFPWYRAIWTECAEMLDQFGWKWWKQQETDWEQLQLELIDIWHFGLSDLLQDLPATDQHDDSRDDSDDDNEAQANPLSPQEQLAEEIAQQYLQHTASRDSTAEQFRQAIETFATTTLSTQRFALIPFFELMQLANLPLQVLFVQYIGKNALNHFRQSHGYQDGQYEKIWDGKEDNEHLSDIINSLSENETTIANLYDTVYGALKDRYQQLQPC